MPKRASFLRQYDYFLWRCREANFLLIDRLTLYILNFALTASLKTFMESFIAMLTLDEALSMSGR